MQSYRFLAVLLAIVAIGCDHGPTIVPAEGVVTYNGEPLPYGVVIFSPSSGQSARGLVQPDGSFVLSTFREGDGATVGSNRVRIACYSSQSPSEKNRPVVGERSLGKLLIPGKYNYASTSGFVAEVVEDCEPFQFELSGPPVRFPK